MELCHLLRSVIDAFALYSHFYRSQFSNIMLDYCGAQRWHLALNRIDDLSDMPAHRIQLRQNNPRWALWNCAQVRKVHRIHEFTIGLNDFDITHAYAMESSAAKEEKDWPYRRFRNGHNVGLFFWQAMEDST